MTTATNTDIDDATDVEPNSDGDYDSESDAIAESSPTSRRRKRRLSSLQQALAIGVVLIAALSALGGWLGWRDYQQRGVEQRRAELLQGGRQGALNLTTIDWQRIDNDTKRILASSTGAFYDEFAQRLKPFTDVVKQSQSKSEGTVTAASLESALGNEARVLVALNVKISNAGTDEDSPRAWRMRISVQKVGADVKMTNVEFVP